MSIGRRLFNLARTELNDLLDRAAPDDAAPPAEVEPDRPTARRRVDMSQLSNEELAAEIERRHREKFGPRPAAPRAKAAPPPAAPRKPADPLARAYATLGVPPGATFETVRKAYRALMRKHHPDRHASAPAEQKAATRKAQELSEAYDLLEKKLRRP